MYDNKTILMLKNIKTKTLLGIRGFTVLEYPEGDRRVYVGDGGLLGPTITTMMVDREIIGVINHPDTNIAILLTPEEVRFFVVGAGLPLPQNNTVVGEGTQFGYVADLANNRKIKLPYNL